MLGGILSDHFESRQPSAIRAAQMEYAKRTDNVAAVNVAIGNVSLPMHPKMQERMFGLAASESPFKEGVVKYTATVGLTETNEAFLKVIGASGFETSGLFSQVVDGGSQGMELVLLGVAGKVNGEERPVLMIDAAYTNYAAMAKRIGVQTVSVQRVLSDEGRFSLPDVAQIEAAIEKYRPSAMVVIPFDNPTGHFYSQEDLDALGNLCAKHGMWLVSDEAYRELKYVDEPTSSVWGIKAEEVRGQRISIETASKVWNACGLRIGAVVTDNQKFHQACVAENTANLCAPAIDQWIFGALAHESVEDLHSWFGKQREYYGDILTKVTGRLKELMPELVVSQPDAAIYFVVDVRRVVDASFDAMDFVMWCAREGAVNLDGVEWTLLVSPMAGFYSVVEGGANPGRTQMRVACVATPEEMALVPELLVELLKGYLKG